MTAPSSLVEIQDLNKQYGDFTAVAGISLQVGTGELFALLGPNGAGKTTTIRMLMGILQPSSGTARIAGLDCFRQRVEVMRHVGYLPDEPIFYDYLRGREIIRFVGEMHGFSKAEIEQRTGGLMERLEMKEAEGEFAVNYSKGMKKKLALICAMLHDPDLLILDEPTNGLDPFATRTLHEIMREKAAEGRTVFFQHAPAGSGGEALQPARHHPSRPAWWRQVRWMNCGRTCRRRARWRKCSLRSRAERPPRPGSKPWRSRPHSAKVDRAARGPIAPAFPEPAANGLPPQAQEGRGGVGPPHRARRGNRAASPLGGIAILVIFGFNAVTLSLSIMERLQASLGPVRDAQGLRGDRCANVRYSCAREPR